MQSFETLENRRLMTVTASVSPTVYGGQEIFISTNYTGNNKVSVETETLFLGELASVQTQIVKISVNERGEKSYFEFSSVALDDRFQGLTVKLGDGHDRFTLKNHTRFEKGAPMVSVITSGGNDTVKVSGGFVLVDTGYGNDIVTAGVMYEPAINNLATTVSLGAGNDLFIGSNYADAVNGGEGADILDTRAGNDYIKFGQGRDVVFAGAGDDYMVIDQYDTSRATVFGGAGRDTMAVFAPPTPTIDVLYVLRNVTRFGIEEYQIDNKG